MKVNTMLFRFPNYLFAVLLLISCTSNKNTGRVMNASTDHKVDRISDLMSQMTLDEKLGQMNQYNGNWDLTGPGYNDDTENRAKNLRSGKVGSMLNVLSVESTREAQDIVLENHRLKIPLIIGYDVIHGYKTMFPIPLAESCSWDLDYIERSARIAAIETSAAGIHWTFAPMVDITRDARWGRVMEGSGEDPYLASLIAASRVRGFQGDDLAAPNTIAACAKHFAGYGFAEGGRDYNSSEITDYTMHNVVLPPFKACVDAGIATFMNGFNELGGQPVTANEDLQRKLLKGKWGFDGFVVSDWGSITELIPHGRAEDLADAAEIAVRAGCDMDMESNAYVGKLKAKVEDGTIPIEIIDEAVERILRIKEKLGLFDDPYKYTDVDREKNSIYTKEHLDVSREMARRSIVLMKNENNLLPLSKSARNIAVIGPLADDKDSPLGSWRAQATPNSAVSLLEGLKAGHDDPSSIAFAKGADLGLGERSFVHHLKINTSDTSGFAEARKIAAQADIVILALGEEAFQSGEGRSQLDIGLQGVQQALMQTIYEVNQNIVLVLMNGRPLAIPWAAEHIPAIVETWFLGSQAGHAIADVLYGDYNPSGKLTMSFPRASSHTPVYYNKKNTGRPDPNGELVFWSHYIDGDHSPLFPFGHGLSYSTFEYGKPNISVIADSKVFAHVRVRVKNTSQVAGEEIVQLYIRDVASKYVRPVLELRGYQKVSIEPGEEKELLFEIGPDQLSYFSPSGEKLLERGKYIISVGASSEQLQSLEFVF